MSKTFRPAALLAALAFAGCGEPAGPVVAAFSESVIRDGAEAAFSRGRRGHAPERVVVRVATMDRHGRPGEAPALTLYWDRADLARFDWANGDRYRLADLARLEFDGPEGARAWRSWCLGGGRGPTLTPGLCGEAGRAAATAFLASEAP